MLKRCVVGVVLISLLSGCIAASAGLAVASVAGVRSNTNSKMPRATAHAIGGNINPDDIKISNAHIGMNKARWTADTPKGRYACNADDMIRDAFCEHR